jgi:hypothetical protein
MATVRCWAALLALGARYGRGRRRRRRRRYLRGA